VYSEYYNYIPPYYKYTAPVYNYYYTNASSVFYDRGTFIQNHYSVDKSNYYEIAVQYIVSEVYLAYAKSYMATYWYNTTDGTSRRYEEYAYSYQSKWGFSWNVSFVYYNGLKFIDSMFYNQVLSYYTYYYGQSTPFGYKEVKENARISISYYYYRYKTKYTQTAAYYAYTEQKYYYNSIIVTPETYEYTPAIETNPIHYIYTEV